MAVRLVPARLARHDAGGAVRADRIGEGGGAAEVSHGQARVHKPEQQEEGGHRAQRDADDGAWVRPGIDARVGAGYGGGGGALLSSF